jgi:hypothetical protein
MTERSGRGRRRNAGEAGRPGHIPIHEDGLREVALQNERTRNPFSGRYQFDSGMLSHISTHPRLCFPYSWGSKSTVTTRRNGFSLLLAGTTTAPKNPFSPPGPPCYPSLQQFVSLLRNVESVYRPNQDEIIAVGIGVISGSTGSGSREVLRLCDIHRCIL